MTGCVYGNPVNGTLVVLHLDSITQCKQWKYTDFKMVLTKIGGRGVLTYVGEMFVLKSSCQT